MPRKIIKPDDIERELELGTNYYNYERVKKLNGNLALPSYVHGYSLAIQYNGKLNLTSTRFVFSSMQNLLCTTNC